jgi:hypothetical protein
LDDEQKLMNDLIDLLGKIFSAGASRMRAEDAKAACHEIETQRVAVHFDVMLAGNLLQLLCSVVRNSERLALFQFQSELGDGFQWTEIPADQPSN